MINVRRAWLGALLLSVSHIDTKPAPNIYHNGWIDFDKNGRKDVFEDPKQPTDARVRDLLPRMNMDEKTAQMVTLYGFGRVLGDELPTPPWKSAAWKDGIANIDEHLNNLVRHPKAATKLAYPFSLHAESINAVQRWFVEETRLGIPVDFTNEGIHGLNHERATPLPAPIGIGSTWNRALVRRAGTTVGREAKALGYTNIYAPILDLARDPRWGRVVETYGEDPFLVAELGKEMTLGLQGEGVASTLKHFAAYGVPKGGRDGHARTDPHISPRELHGMHLYPFRRVIQEARALGVMSSYNDWDGEPVTGSRYFLTELLRDQYGFQGYVVSDSHAVEYLHEKHRVSRNMKDSVRQVVEAGLNVRTAFDPPQEYLTPLRQLVAEGSLSPQVIDARVADVLRVKFKLGLFDQPYVADPARADRIVHTREDEALSLQLHRESLVLLKNAAGMLPLDASKLRRVLVTGPLADATGYAISRYGPSNNPATSVLAGLRARLGATVEVDYAPGCDVVDATWPESEIIPTPLTAAEQQGIDEAVAKARLADIVIAVVGEDEKRVGESLSRTALGLPGRQLQLLQALHATGKPVVMVLINGRPLVINWENRFLPAILEAWFPGPSGGTAIAEALLGDFTPGGKLSVTFPKSIGQIELNFPFKPASHAGQPGDGPNGYGRTRVEGPLYPFGHGLSYTTFKYDNLVVTPSADRIAVRVDVRNSGTRPGDEVVQLYFKDVVSRVTTYDTQLRGFERVSLKPGETETVEFALRPADLAFVDRKGKWTVEPGEFEILAGSSSEDIRLRKTFRYSGKR